MTAITVYVVRSNDPKWQSAKDRLSDDEAERAARFVFDRDRIRFIASHRAVRRIVARATNLGHAEVTFETGDHGKPYFHGLSFNLSHSGDLALVAVCARGELGVDVEQVNAERDIDLIAPTVFSPRELDALARATDKRRAFFRAWARKEAFVKLLGVGVGGPLAAFDVSLEAADGDVLLEVRIPNAPRARVIPLQVHADYEAAIATTELDAEITLLDETP